MAFWEQDGFDIRLEWGLEGVRRLAPVSDVVIIVDVLSFTTAVDVAVAGGVRVYPYRFHDASATAFAREIDAHLAVDREDATPEHPWSLSPASLRTPPLSSRLVLPSPNGATLSVEAHEGGATVLAGCLRNASVVARAAARLGQTIALVPAGERWSEDGSLRPAIEDLIGAGAIIAALDPANPSPEARVAVAAYRDAARDLRGQLLECVSGRELRERGYVNDVEIAADVDASRTVPVLINGAYRSME